MLCLWNKSRGYRVTDAMARQVSPDETCPEPPESRSKKSEDEIDVWTETVAQGFARHIRCSEELLEVMELFALRLKTECYLVGAGKLLEAERCGWSGGIVWREHVARGAQARRANGASAKAYREGVAGGSDLAVSIAQPGVFRRGILCSRDSACSIRE